MKRNLLLILTLCMLTINAIAQHKREFRGAWIQCVNGQFQGMSTAKMQEYLTYQLNVLQRQGVNLIIFQLSAINTWFTILQCTANPYIIIAVCKNINFLSHNKKFKYE